MKHSKIILVTSILALSVFVFTKCLHSNSIQKTDPRGSEYAGAKACIACHKEVYNSYSHNNHYKTSSLINKDSIHSFIQAAERFYFIDSSHIIVEEREGSFFQSYYVNGEKKISAKFDIAFGSAEKAQTYTYWKNNTLFQLPLTYFTGMHAWANSPGFTASHANFNRVIESRCFECHASYIGKEFVQSTSLAVTEKIDSASIVYGIDCERCHGPAAKHVAFQQENPNVKKPMFITSMKLLSTERQLDFCGTCHSGNDLPTQRSLFGFLPGDTLSNFYFPAFGLNKPEPDVHGKQLQLLQSSKCFQMSTITCGSCHKVHGAEENKNTVAIANCMSCHQNSQHAINNLKEQEHIAGATVLKNCIDCHMPLQSSKAISFNNGAGLKNISYLLRTHKIGIYK